MQMPNQIPITEFKNLTESDKTLIVWQGLMDTWTKLQETIEHQKEIEADTKVHHKLLITGNGDPSLMERIRNVEKFVTDFRYWARFVGGALILQTLTFAFAVIVALIKFLPLLEQLAKNPK